jgi:hypothetical protein
LLHGISLLLKHAGKKPAVDEGRNCGLGFVEAICSTGGRLLIVAQASGKELVEAYFPVRFALRGIFSVFCEALIRLKPLTGVEALRFLISPHAVLTKLPQGASRERRGRFFLVY